MAESFDGGHRETARDLPRPLQSGWYPGTWALPATTISAASLVVVVVVFGVLQVGGRSSVLFRLPWSSGWSALAAAVVAWGIAISCRNRPGRHWPRWWALSLAAASSGVAVLDLAGSELGEHPRVHALALALLASSLALLPRLLKLHPAHWLVQHVAPLGLAAALFVALPAALVFGRHAVAERTERVAATVAELTREAAAIREVTSFDWSSSIERRHEAQQQMQRLADLPLEAWAPDRYLWQGAAVLGEEERLAAAYREILDAVVAGLDPERTPRLWQPQFAWNLDGQVWERDPVFPELSAGVAGYHWRTSRLLRLLAPPSGEGDTLRAIATLYRDQVREADRRLAGFSRSWAGDWVPPLVAAAGTAPDLDGSSLVDLFRRPLLADGSLHAASLEELLDLTLWRARGVADPARGCGTREYREDEKQYFRIDCYAYRASLDPVPHAELRAEMRVVYAAEEALAPLAERDLPAEVYFLFPVPAAREAAPYRHDVMAALKAVVAAAYPDTTLEMIERDGSAARGFSFATRDGRRLRVVSHEIDDLSDGATGIQVRAYYVDRSL